jgi:hypothetical protein
MTAILQDPTTKYPQAEAQQQKRPGQDAKLHPAADHGETSYRGSGKLKGRRALITGADSGIGRAVAIAFAREGADVVVSYLNEDEDARETERWIVEAGRKAVLAKGDISDEAHCKSLIEKAVSELGGLDILINNAAFQATHESIQEFSTAEWDYTFRTNIHAMFWLCKYAEPHLLPGSTVVNTASINSFKPKSTLLAYATTKGAIATYTKALGELWADKGIRVNAVAPGPVWTPLIPSTMPEDQVKEFGQNVPLKRPGQPAELAPVYVLLASDESSYITGQVYGVTGGTVLA